jgi:hypothetical protein
MAMQSTDSGSNQRRSTRKQVQFSAFLSADKGTTHFGCTIRDLSETGARVRLTRNIDLPAIVHLVDVTNKIAYEAAVVWRRAPLYGLAFTNSYKLSSTETPLFLRKLWFESVR